MGARRLKLLFLVPPLAALLLGALLGWVLRPPASAVAAAADANAVAQSTLLSVRDQGRLTSYAARFVAVVSASETRLGLTARKTLIMPGDVRYSVDLARLGRRSVDWDETTRLSRSPCRPLKFRARRSI